MEKLTALSRGNARAQQPADHSVNDLRTVAASNEIVSLKQSEGVARVAHKILSTVNIRIGNGFDIHRLIAGRALILGGVDIPFDCGLDGFSDGDVLSHAIIDSLLGATALGDIGTWFPPGDVSYSGADSTKLLRYVATELKKKSFSLVNVDSTILCEEPKLNPFISMIKESLSHALSVSPNQIGVKATTMEQLGPIGQGQAIAALACSLVQSG